jgi:hypothetical protein
MKEMALVRNSNVNSERAASGFERTQEIWTSVLLGSTMLSVLAGLGGLVFSTASWFFAEHVKGSHTIGTLLLVALFPLLYLVAHSLDKIREAEKAIRVERCKKTGMKDADC